ncbi:C-X-C chemokine receptor type 2-like [Megalops cyprinoides]|uniref:C-X-C chemokine receptor type 2-like n=1 Tax=Megalops cyprinoides TaxID=118141 RepID=UPI001864CD0A|nr:C-X-C chemokine receptor type 2-like [Megalops cyprinoides]
MFFLTGLNTSLFVDDFSEFYDSLNASNSTNFTTFRVDQKTQPCEAMVTSLLVNVGVCIFYVLVFLLAIPGNLIVGVVIVSSKQPLLPSDLYLLHLAVADILLALTLPFWAVVAIQGWVLGNALCKLVSLVQEVTFYSSILFLACISVDRYMVIVRAMETRRERRQARSWAACVAVWTLGGALSLPAFFSTAFRPQGSERMVCAEHYDPDSADQWRLATRLLRHSLGFVLPLSIMLSCYGVTAARLLRTRGFQKQRAMRVIVAVVAAFLLCWTPYHLALMAETLLRARVLPNECAARASVDLATFAGQSLGLLHCCVNPVLYAFVGEKFRRNLLRLLHRKGVVERPSVPRAGRPASQSSDGTSVV